MPRKLAGVLLAVVGSHLAAEVGPWQGLTDSGLRFQGNLSRITADRLILENTSRDPALQYGIPLGEIKWIQWTGAADEPELFLQALESALPLLALLDRETMARLEAVLNSLAASGQWRRLIRWTTRLVEVEQAAMNLDRIRILHTWSLFELGLLGECQKWIANLTGESDPLETDPRLCWLAGRAALRDNKLEEATFWARLPVLRIPVTGGPIESDLQELRQLITEKEHLEK